MPCQDMEGGQRVGKHICFDGGTTRPPRKILPRFSCLTPVLQLDMLVLVLILVLILVLVLVPPKFFNSDTFDENIAG